MSVFLTTSPALFSTRALVVGSAGASDLLNILFFYNCMMCRLQNPL